MCALDGEHHFAVNLGKQCVILAHADVFAGMKFSAALTHDSASDNDTRLYSPFNALKRDENALVETAAPRINKIVAIMTAEVSAIKPLCELATYIFSI